MKRRSDYLVGLSVLIAVMGFGCANQSTKNPEVSPKSNVTGTPSGTGIGSTADASAGMGPGISSGASPNSVSNIGGTASGAHSRTYQEDVPPQPTQSTRKRGKIPSPPQPIDEATDESTNQ